MSEETNKASTEAKNCEDTLEQATSDKAETQAETPEEEKEADRPGVCCGSCS